MIIRHLKQDVFIQNVIKMISGATIAQLVPILAIPLMTRVYSAQSFGYFAIYFSFLMVLSIIATLRLEMSIVLTSSNKIARLLVTFCILLTSTFTLVLYLILFVFEEEIVELFNIQSIVNTLYLLPISVFLIAVLNTLTYWMNSQKRYGDLAKSKIVRGLSVSAFSLILGFVGLDIFGLILGHMAGLCLCVVYLFSISGYRVEPIDKIKTVALVRRFKKIPLYAMPMGVLNAISNQIKPLVFTSYYSASVVGVIYMSEKVMAAPLGIISASYSSVFFKEIVNSDKQRYLYVRSFLVLLSTALILLSPVYFFGPELFALVLGGEWREAGSVASVIYFMVCVSFATGAVSPIFTAINKNEVSFYWQVVYLIGLSFIIVSLHSEGFIGLLQVIVCWSTFMYFLLFLLGAYLIEKS